ncbi:MAG: type II secretion system GspH family protein [Desulfobulbaceae bacterium]|nr:type II secretion system GspH family protein [Desulfobulbaceae bacterium]HIJ78182.1 type II secretion system protein [Deltaproteobacteria bacterium]
MDSAGSVWRRDAGLTLTELVIAIVILCIFTVLAIKGVAHYRQKAIDITVKYDLRNFRMAQDDYLGGHGGNYLGEVGQSTGEDGQPNDFNLPGFVASKGVRFTVTSSPVPFIVQGSHLKSSVVYEYDFSNDTLTLHP